MGLDMELHAKLDVHGYKHASNADDRALYHRVLEVVDALEWVDHDTPQATVSVTVAYWRKVHAVHQWFVHNVQDGNNNCHEYPVGREQLGELLAICDTVLVKKDPAEVVNLLGRWTGFEFGTGDIQETWYWEGLELTSRQLSHCLVHVPEPWNFYYQSSW